MLPSEQCLACNTQQEAFLEQSVLADGQEFVLYPVPSQAPPGTKQTPLSIWSFYLEGLGSLIQIQDLKDF